MSRCPIHPPKPEARPEKVSLWRYLRLFRRDILSAQPAKLYKARMAEFRTPFFRSYLFNEPELWKLVLQGRAKDFPKSNRVRAGLEPLLGNSVFVTNGPEWEHQRRIIDPAFEGGRLREVFPAFLEAARAAAARMGEAAADDSKPANRAGEVEVEAQMSHAAADVIFRSLFSMPIEHRTARAVFEAFRAHQSQQPLLNLAAFLRLPHWVPRFHRKRTLQTARHIRALITEMTAARAALIAEGRAPDDLATKIMTTPDPETGACFDTAEMVDQVAIFFLAGHETSASALGWALYLCALDPELQEKLAEEGEILIARPDAPPPDFSCIARLKLARDTFREALRLYPPVPMMVRETTAPEEFRGRAAPKGSQIVISPWHLGRHERIWSEPDAFCPARWSTDEGRAAAREGFIPFSTGPRVCPGAGFAMIEGVLILSMLLRHFRFRPVEGKTPEPVAHLTVRARHGIHLQVTPRRL